MNEFPGLTWEFSDLSTSVDFMDMTITLNKTNEIETTLVEKKLNLHLYIPPHSAHRCYWGLCIAHCSEFLPFAPVKMTNSSEQGFFQMTNCMWV